MKDFENSIIGSGASSYGTCVGLGLNSSKKFNITLFDNENMKIKKLYQQKYHRYLFFEEKNKFQFPPPKLIPNDKIQELNVGKNVLWRSKCWWVTNFGVEECTHFR